MLNRKIFISSLIAVTTLAACVTPTPMVWTRPGATEADFERDKNQCIYESSALTQSVDYGYRTIFGQELDRAMRRNELAGLCMKAKGWSQQTTTATNNPNHANTPADGSPEGAAGTDTSQITRVNFDSEVGKKHPDWQLVLSSKKFKNWLSDQSDVKKRAIETRSPQGTIVVLDAYKASTP